MAAISRKLAALPTAPLQSVSSNQLPGDSLKMQIPSLFRILEYSLPVRPLPTSQTSFPIIPAPGLLHLLLPLPGYSLLCIFVATSFVLLRSQIKCHLPEHASWATELPRLTRALLCPCSLRYLFVLFPVTLLDSRPMRAGVLGILVTMVPPAPVTL